jgi:hypothetical protein
MIRNNECDIILKELDRDYLMRIIDYSLTQLLQNKLWETRLWDYKNQQERFNVRRECKILNVVGFKYMWDEIWMLITWFQVYMLLMRYLVRMLEVVIRVIWYPEHKYFCLFYQKEQYWNLYFMCLPSEWNYWLIPFLLFRWSLMYMHFWSDSKWTIEGLIAATYHLIGHY